ncbi:aldo/keto reductase [Pseudoduganella sp. RAF19]|jgi:aryl-alcohol dehydrogenase-like predicted oxidoreductase|uniref:aldo/keto reductase n=3 Tax=unclassified Pseudoduganella TaxID=2637179 RepID=UPI003F9706BF
MDYVNLGHSGLKVSPIGLGCMSYGVQAREWRTDEATGRDYIRQALESGINLFDTADMYGGGESEEVLGRALRDFAVRDDVVIATKVYYPMRPGPNGRGLSRKAICAGVDASLRRLGTDYIDLYQIHRWDPCTPIEETLEALHDLVKAGKVRYLGASSMYAWQFCKALYLAQQHGWTRFVSMQPHYNLLNREEEREMLPLCRAEGIGVLPWSPLARGRLARPWQEASSSDRVRFDQTAARLYNATEAADKMVVDAVGAVASRREVPRAQIALAWLLQQECVAAPIVGATKAHHLADAVAALSLQLDRHELDMLEQHYVPHAVSFFE